MAQTKIMRAYMIYDEAADKWLSRGALGMYTWGPQEKAEIWTIKKTATDTMAQMFGPRAKKAVIKTFVLIPVCDKE